MILSRLSIHSSGVMKGLNLAKQGSGCLAMLHTQVSSQMHKDSPFNDGPATINLPDSQSGQVQTAQGREHEFARNRSRDTVDTHDTFQSLGKYEVDSHDADTKATQFYDDSCNISLNSVMQSNVPEPYGPSGPSNLNMPGNGIMQRHKYESSRRTDHRDSIKRKFHTSIPFSNQGGQSYYVAREDFEPPAPQGVQGDDCVTFKLWLENCHRYNLDCDEDLQGIQSGRKTLSQVFAEQDELIKSVKSRTYMTSTPSPQGSSPKETGTEVRTSGSQSPKGADDPESRDNLTQGQKLKRAVKEYGSTVIVFHVGISLISLGSFYMLVSSGIDVISLLIKIGVPETLFQSTAVAGASTFVIAYAVHKVFAPVRIAMTLTCTPLIVRYLRRIGFLKPPRLS